MYKINEVSKWVSIPVITFVDTPGAYPGIGAEQKGKHQRSPTLSKPMALTVPNIVIIGEGGSGGAIALASSNNYNVGKFYFFNFS